MTPLLSTALLRTQSDTRLASLARDGHELAFEAIVERYRRPLHAYCRRVLPEARSEDVVQQTFLAAWSALGRGEDVRDLRAWLYRIAHNNSINNLKRAGYDYDELRESLEHRDTPEDDAERRAVIRETLAGVAALPERQREALLSTAVDGRSQAEVARDLGLTDGAVRQLVHRARATLRAAATAITPFPLATWAATAGGAGGSGVSERVAELAAGAGTAGLGSLLAKGGAAAVMAGAIAATPVAVHHTRSGDAARAASPAATTTSTKHAPAAAAGATPVSAATAVPDSGEKDSGRGRGSDDASDDDHRGRGGDEAEDRSAEDNDHMGSERHDDGSSEESEKHSGSGRIDDEDQHGSRHRGGEGRGFGDDEQRWESEDDQTLSEDETFPQEPLEEDFDHSGPDDGADSGSGEGSGEGSDDPKHPLGS